MIYDKLIDEYVSGADLLRRAVAGMTEAHLDATPVAGKWSTRQVLCHLADFEPIYADRMKRVIAEQQPTLLSGDPDLFSARLAYHQRSAQDELDLIAVVRRQMGTILRTLGPDDFQRTGIHSSDGPLTLETLLTRITSHVPHHVRFIEEKRHALGL